VSARARLAGRDIVALADSLEYGLAVMAAAPWHASRPEPLDSVRVTHAAFAALLGARLAAAGGDAPAVLSVHGSGTGPPRGVAARGAGQTALGSPGTVGRPLLAVARLRRRLAALGGAGEPGLSREFDDGGGEPAGVGRGARCSRRVAHDAGATMVPNDR
jgi:hypothetical protein